MSTTYAKKTSTPVIPSGPCQVLDDIYEYVIYNGGTEKRRVVDNLGLLIGKVLPHLKAVLDQREQRYTRLLVMTKAGELLWEVHLFKGDTPTYHISWPEGTFNARAWDEDKPNPHEVATVSTSLALMVILSSQARVG